MTSVLRVWFNCAHKYFYASTIEIFLSLFCRARVVKLTCLFSPFSAHAHLLHTYCLNERRKDNSFERGLLERVFSL